MPSTTAAQSITTTFLLLIILLLAFFPSLFHYLWYTPLYLLSTTATYLISTSQPTPRIAPQLIPPASMSWFQKTLSLPSKSRGSYLITDDIVSALPELKSYKVGLLNLFIQHTSCALSLNENWDSDVREDMSDALDRLAPEDKKGELYRHSAEGLDDMPAHIKSALIGASVTVPIRDGKMALGTWQGIWYLEFRAQRHARKVVATIQGEKM
jgi:secondary thiamine-phosphate synthase enzyme